MQQTSTAHPSNHQSHPPTLPSHSTWPSMLRKLASKAPSIVTNPAPDFVSIRKGTKPAQYCTSSPRKSLTDSDRKRICQYHVDNPFLTQTKIGGEFLEDDICPSEEISRTGHLQNTLQSTNLSQQSLELSEGMIRCFDSLRIDQLTCVYCLVPFRKYFAKRRRTCLSIRGTYPLPTLKLKEGNPQVSKEPSQIGPRRCNLRDRR